MNLKAWPEALNQALYRFWLSFARAETYPQLPECDLHPDAPHPATHYVVWADGVEGYICEDALMNHGEAGFMEVEVLDPDDWKE